ncbi:hypothetical protein ACHAWF_011709 [Thalassiosira exigua]
MDNPAYSALLSRAATAMGFWHSYFPAFVPLSPPPVPTIRPPPMTVSHYYYRMLSPKREDDGAYLPTLLHINGAKAYAPKNVLRHSEAPQYATPSAFSFRFGTGTRKNTGDVERTNKADEQHFEPRIAIIGGGIAGVTAANALGKKFAPTNAKIVVFEGCAESSRCVNFGNCEQPAWIAATARNANSLVPGAAMHVMAQRNTLLKIAKDTVREWYSEKMESLQHWLQTNRHMDYQLTKNVDNFDVVPPYFALHLFRCLGISATWDERATFLTFLKNFLMTSLSSGEAHANERGKLIQQLAKSNRHSFLEAINGGEGGKELASKIGLGRGFLSLHRKSDDAIHAFNEGKLFGESVFIMPLEEAIKLEPRISHFPIKNQLFAVHRIDDYTANSAVFVQDLIEKIKTRGVEYRCGDMGMIQDVFQSKLIKSNSTTNDSVLATSPAPRFKVLTNDGSTHDFDYVVLAAGVNTPLLARKLSVGESCPTYPLRGYSLTVYTNHGQDEETNIRLEKGKSTNLLKMPLSIDDMYCSSVGGKMARLAGFGELVGYRDKAVDVPSLAPRVMSRYARALFPESNVTDETALQCFRPMSPDDIPIVGGVRSVPGLFLHTGHGTLGWTLCLATSECLAQALHDDASGNKTQDVYHLPGDVTVERASLSPDRFY